MDLAARLYQLALHRRAIRSLILRNLRDKYVGSVLGLSWAVIHPLLIMCAISFVFSCIMKTEIRHFPLLVLSALLPWNFFANSISESATSITGNRGILSQFVIPREAITLSIVCANFLNFLFGFIIILPIFAACNVSILKYCIFLPAILLLHLIFTLGISLLLSVANIFLKDTVPLLSIVVMFLFWITPVFYSVDMVPARFQWLLIVNPAACFAAVFRSLLYHGSIGTQSAWLLALGYAMASIVGGYALFIREESRILKAV